MDKAQQKKTVKKEQESSLLRIKHLIRKEREGSLSMKIKIELILNSNRWDDLQVKTSLKVVSDLRTKW